MSRSRRASGRRFWWVVLFLLVTGCGDTSNKSDPTESTDASQNAATSAPVEPWKEKLPSGVVLHLSFDAKTLCKEAGRFYAKDLSANKNGGFIRDAVPVKGRFGTALSFDGKKSRVGGSDASLPFATGQGSISVWFLTRKADAQPLFSYGVPKSDYSREMSLLNPSGLRFYHSPGGDKCQVENVPISLNEWHHFVAVYSEHDRVVTFYLDGEKKGATPGYFYTSPSGYLIGVGNSDKEHFDGLIDELIVFNSVLTEAEVQALYKRKEYADEGKVSLDSLPVCK